MAFMTVAVNLKHQSCLPHPPTHLLFKDVPAYSIGFAILTQSFSLDSDYAKYSVLL